MVFQAGIGDFNQSDGLPVTFSNELVGDEGAVGRQVWALEGLGGLRTLSTTPASYIIEETGIAGDYPGRSFRAVESGLGVSRLVNSLAPQHLQALRFDYAFFASRNIDRPEASRLARLLNTIGVFTCADLLALGSDEVSRAAEFMPGLRDSIGDARRRRLAAVILTTTGHTLSSARPGPESWPRYYSDITLATPALALPTSRYSWYGALGLQAPQTVGSLLSGGAPEERYEDATFKDFVDSLVDKVVSPYDAAKSAASRIEK